jgi:hypothetical protein
LAVVVLELPLRLLQLLETKEALLFFLVLHQLAGVLAVQVCLEPVQAVLEAGALDLL